MDAVLNKNSAYFLICAVLISVGVSLPRFGPGIPMSVDTTSHLYKILFLQYWWKQGVSPFWSPDWYAGSPAILLYPPLGYYIVAGVSMFGLDPLLAYKLFDGLFYWLAPLAVYFLGKELGFSKGQSALGALLFSVVPEVIENYLFYGRFPTVIAIPIFCTFIIVFHRALLMRGGSLNVLASILSMSALLLTHHLSALIAGIVAVLMVAVTIGRQGLASPLLKLITVAAGTAGVTAFWLMPFITSINLFSANQFYNRNVTFPFLKFTYFGFDVTSYLLGIAQFVLAALSVQSIVGSRLKGRLRVSAAIFFPALLLGMALFEVGEFYSAALMVVGEWVVAGLFVVFLGQFIAIRYVRRLMSRKNGLLFAVLWFIVFLWVGLGYFALPILQLPFISTIWTKTMDVYRVWLYLALPMSLLAAFGLQRSISRLLAWKPVAVAFLLVLVIAPIGTGVALKMNYAFSHNVNLVLPYSTANAEIPTAITDYFQNDASPGRILAINVPFWIYVLPNYAGKPIVDGWYPQTKLVTPLVNINDYRLDDLETAPNGTARLNTWKKLVSDEQLLDITWVIIGDNGTLANMVMNNSPFREQLSIPYGAIELKVYKALEVPSFINTDAQTLESMTRPNPDTIILNLKPKSNSTTMVVKEAYFPTWAATADGHQITVKKETNSGYILLTIPAGTHQVMIYQVAGNNSWNTVSAITLLACVVVTGAFLVRRRLLRK